MNEMADHELFQLLLSQDAEAWRLVWECVVLTECVDHRVAVHSADDASQAYDMVEEISKWMKDDFGAVDLKATTPAGTVALKRFRIGEGMDVEVAVNWDKRQTSQTWNSKIDITFKTRELEAENAYQRAELGKATDPARASEYSRTGINYFTVNPKVNAEVGKSGMVFH